MTYNPGNVNSYRFYRNSANHNCGTVGTDTVTSEHINLYGGVPKGSGTPHTVKAGSITKDQVREIAETKMPDLNANDVDAAMRIIEGTARQMGITVS